MIRSIKRAWKRKLATVAVSAITLLGGAGAAYATPADDALPTGGTVWREDAQELNGLSGTDNTKIYTHHDNLTMDVTNKLNDAVVLHWNTFDVGKNATVNFVQKDVNALMANVVMGGQLSEIAGKINANGQLMLVNNAGISFLKGAEINVGSLIASTMAVEEQSLTNGKYTFNAKNATVEGKAYLPAANAAITNLGNINAKNGLVALISNNKVENKGYINSHKTAENSSFVQEAGTYLVAGETVELAYDNSGKIGIEVKASSIKSQVINSGTLSAQNGYVLMTAGAANEVTGSIVNNTGNIEATKLVKHEDGSYELAPSSMTIRAIDLQADQVNVGEKASVHAKELKVTSTYSDIAVTDAAAKAKTSTISSAALGDTLKDTNVTLRTRTTGISNADIRIDAAVTKTGGNSKTLTLEAQRNNIIAAAVKGEGGRLNLVLTAGAADGKDEAGNAVVTANKTKGINLIEADVNTAGGSITSNNDTYFGLTRAESEKAWKEGATYDRTIATGGGNLAVDGNVVLATGGTVTIDAGAAGDNSVKINGNVVSGNSFYYQSFGNGTRTWEAAYAGAHANDSSDSHLATITSQYEDAAVLAAINDGSGSMAYTAGMATKWTEDKTGSRTWFWADGTEAEKGVVFTEQSRKGVGTAEAKLGEVTPLGYTNWRSGEPNGEGVGGDYNSQHYLTVNYDTYAGSTEQNVKPASWDDTHAGDNKLNGYVVETELTGSSLAIKNVGTVAITGNIGVAESATAAKKISNVEAVINDLGTAAEVAADNTIALSKTVNNLNVTADHVKLLGEQIVTAGDVAVTSKGSIQLGGSIDSQGSISLASGKNNNDGEPHNLYTEGAMSLTAGKSLTITGNVVAKGDLKLESGKAADSSTTERYNTVIEGGNVTAYNGGSLTAKVTKGSFEVNNNSADKVIRAKNITVETDGDAGKSEIRLGAVVASGDVSLTSAQDRILLNGGIETSKSFTAEGTKVSIYKDLTAGKDVNVTATAQQITYKANADGTTNYSNPNYYDGVRSYGEVKSTSGAVKMTSGTNMVVNKIDAKGDVELNSHSTINVSQNKSGYVDGGYIRGANVTLTAKDAQGTVVIPGIISQGDMNIEATTGNLVLDGFAMAKNNVNLAAGSKLYTNSLEAVNGKITLDAKGAMNLGFDKNGTAIGGSYLYAGNGIQATADGDLTAEAQLMNVGEAADIKLKSNNGSVNLVDKAKAQAKPYTINKNLQLDSKTPIAPEDQAKLEAQVMSAGKVVIDAGQDVSLIDLVAAGSGVTIDAQTGSVTAAGNRAAGDGITGGNGDIRITADQDITLVGTVNEGKDSVVELTANKGNIITGGSETGGTFKATATLGNVTVNNNIQASENIKLTADNGTVLVDRYAEGQRKNGNVQVKTINGTEIISGKFVENRGVIDAGSSVKIFAGADGLRTRDKYRGQYTGDSVIKAGSNVEITSNGFTELEGSVSGRNVTVTNNSNQMQINGDITAERTMTLENKSGSIYLGVSRNVNLVSKGTSTKDGVTKGLRIITQKAEGATGEFNIRAGEWGKKVSIDGKAVKLDAVNGNVNLGADSSLQAAYGGIDVTAGAGGGYVNVAGTLNSTSDITITQKNGDYADAAGISVRGEALINGTKVTLHAEDGRILTEAGTKVSGTDVTVLAEDKPGNADTKGDITLGGQAKASNALLVQTTNGNITTERTAELTGNNVKVDANIGHATVHGKLTAANDLTVQVTTRENKKDINGNANVQVEGDAVLTGTNVTLQAVKKNYAQSDVIVKSGATIEADNILVDTNTGHGGNIKFFGTVGMGTEEAPRTSTNVTMEAHGYVNVGSELAVGGNVTLLANKTNVTATKDITAGGDVTVKALGGVTLQGVENGGNVLIEAGSAKSFDQKKDTYGGINVGKVESNGNVTMHHFAGSENYSGGDISVQGINSDGSILLWNERANNGIVLDGVLKSGAAADSAIVVASRDSVTNNVGAGLMDIKEGASWQVYAKNPESVQFNSLNSNNFAGFGNGYEAGKTAGLNMYIFQDRPVLTITTEDAAKVYGEAYTGEEIALSYSSSLEGKYTEAFLDGTLTGEALAKQFTTGKAVLASEGFAATAEPDVYDISIDTTGITSQYEIQTVPGELTVFEPMMVTLAAAPAATGTTAAVQQPTGETTQQIKDTSNLDGTGSIGQQSSRALNSGVDKVLGLADGKLPMFKVAKNRMANYGVYEIASTPDAVKLTAATAKKTPKLPVGPGNNDNYRQIKRTLVTESGNAQFDLTYNGETLNIYPADQAAKELVKAGEETQNVELLSKALFTSQGSLGVDIADLDGVVLYADATEAEAGK